MHCPRPRLLGSLALLLLIAVAVPGGLLGPRDAIAGDPDDEVGRVKQRIEFLVREAKALKERGRHAAAEELMAQARELKQRLERHQEEQGEGRREGGERGPREMTLDQARRVLQVLHQAMEALTFLQKPEELRAITKIARGLQRRLEQHEAGQERPAREREERPAARRERAGGREREIAEQRLELMRLAMRALREGERKDAMEILERAMHALEVGLSGRRDEEAQEIRRSAPPLAHQAEVLGLAAHLYEEWGHEDRAGMVAKLAEELARIARRGAGERGREREAIEHHLEIWRFVFAAMREAEKRDLAERAEHMIHALELAREGRSDEEAREVRRTAPSREQQMNLLEMAARLYREWGHEDRMHAVLRLAGEMAEERGQRREQDEDRRPAAEAHEGALHRLEQLQERVGRLMHALEEVREQLGAMKREMRGR